MDLTQLPDLLTALKLAGLRPDKTLGQHFLVDRPSLERIVAAARINPHDIVLEIGPGLGVLTTELVARAERVIAVETDPKLAALLRRDQPANLTVVEADILQFDFESLPAGYIIAANIPYYLTSSLLRRLTSTPHPPRIMSLLVQREVAERVAAPAGQMSLLSLVVQFSFTASVAGLVPKSCFWPVPKVDSAILVLEDCPPAFSADPQRLFRLAKAGFGERRKQLKNSLAGGLQLTTPDTLALLEQAEIIPSSRAQELSLPDWGRLYQAALSRKVL